jgi:sulfatase maturation enzyme AslB (radical SAM superfamily)
LEGKRVSPCTRCYKIEDAGGISFRQRNNDEWQEKIGHIVSPELSYYDIRNDNLCNLACRICHPGASSQLEKEYKKLNWPIEPTTRFNKMSEIVNYNTVRSMQIAGGEPTLMPEFKLFLEKAIAKNKTDIDLKIITNGTNLNKEYISLLSNFKNIEFGVSLDGYDQINKYIRWPTNWQTLTQNIDKMFDLTDNVFFCVCVNIWNVANLSQLIGFLEERWPRPLILMNEAVPVNGVDITPWNYPDKARAIEELKKLYQSYSYINEEFFRNKVDYFINNMQSSTLVSEKLQRFFEYNDSLDQSRGIALIDYIPELEACRTYIK